MKGSAEYNHKVRKSRLRKDKQVSLLWDFSELLISMFRLGIPKGEKISSSVL